MLVDAGYAGITTRRLAEEAGVNHGLVHYYFGSVENLLVRTLERFTERLVARQREMYATDMPFLEKWRTAMRYLVSEDVAYEKVWLELQALAWNRPELRERVDHVNAEWRAVLLEAFAEPREHYGIEMPLDVLVSLVITFNEGIILERLPGSPKGTTSSSSGSTDGCRADAADVSEQTRARYPDAEGYVERDGVRLFYEVYGEGEPTVLLLPTWSIIHSRHWKMQIPYLARHCRVVTFDGRGNGRSDRPAERIRRARVRRRRSRGAGCDRDRARGPRLVLARGAARADPGGRAPGARRGAVFIGPSVPFGEPVADRQLYPWDEELDTDEGWAKYNRYYWLRDYHGFLEFFFSQMFTEPHSTKPIEDCVGWGLETTAETLVATQLREWLDEDTARDLCRRVRCPVLVIQARRTRSQARGRGIALAEETGGELVLLEGSGTAPTSATRSRSTCCCATS